jgi:hypothetical protein
MRQSARNAAPTPQDVNGETFERRKGCVMSNKNPVVRLARPTTPARSAGDDRPQGDPGGARRSAE